MFVHSLYHSQGYYYYFFYKIKHCNLKCACIVSFVISVGRIFLSAILFQRILFIYFFSVDECKNTLIQFGVQDITPSSVARVIGMKN